MVTALSWAPHLKRKTVTETLELNPCQKFRPLKLQMTPHNISKARTGSGESICTLASPIIHRHVYLGEQFSCSFLLCPFRNIKTWAGRVNADVLQKWEWGGSKRQPRGMLIHNVGEQAHQSVTWSCYAKHILTLSENGLIQKTAKGKRKKKMKASRKKKKIRRQTAKGHERVNNHQKGPSSFTEKKTP